MQRREILILDGITYTRYPDSPNKRQRNYFTAPWKSGKGNYHRELWQKHYGPVPVGYHIHHKDHNPLNNALDNLICLSPKEHAAAHPEVAGMPPEHLAAIRPLASAWHGSEAGLAWHRAHGKATWEDRPAVDDCCDVCGQIYQTFMPDRLRPHCCSRRCSRALADAAHRYEQQLPCPICGTLFWQSRSKQQPSTCSRRCGKLLSWQRRRACL